MSIRIVLHCALALLLAACASTIPRTWELPPGVQTKPVNGYEMAYVERGAGAPVVFVHGTGTDYRWWTPQLDAFGERHRAIAVSLRHYYPERWDGRADTLTMRQHVTDLAAFIRSLDAGKVHLVGWSRGGQAALQLATRQPELLRSLVLVDTAPVPSLFPPSPEAAAAADRRRQFVGAAIEHLQRGETEAGLERMVDGGSGAGAWKALPEPAKQTVRDNAWSIKSLLDDAAEPLRCEDVRRIDLPVLLVSGERSATEYLVMRDAVQRCLMRSESAVIANAAHAMSRANPAAFNATLLGFLARHTP